LQCFAFLLAVATEAIGCAPAIDVHTIVFPGADVARYETFSFGGPGGVPDDYETSARSAEISRRVRLLVASLLASKGYAERAQSDGDFVVQIAVGRREREELVRTPPLPHPRPVRPAWFEAHEDKDVVEDVLVIDVLDAKSQQTVWHGGARVEIDSERIDDALLKRATTKVLEVFPMRRGER
jgi:hypothetical protein